MIYIAIIFIVINYSHDVSNFSIPTMITYRGIIRSRRGENEACNYKSKSSNICVIFQVTGSKPMNGLLGQLT